MNCICHLKVFSPFSKAVEVAAYKNESTQFIVMKLIFVKVAECDILNLVVLKNINIKLRILGNFNDAGQKYCLTQAMPLVISLHILLFSLIIKYLLSLRRPEKSSIELLQV